MIVEEIVVDLDLDETTRDSSAASALKGQNQFVMGNTLGHLGIFLHGFYEGGAERTMLNLADQIARNGCKVDLVAARAQGPFLSQLPTTVHLVDLKAKRMLLSLPALYQYIRKQQPNALLSGIDYTNIIAILAWRMTRKSGNLVVVEHNTLSKRIQQMPFLFRFLLPKLMRIFYPMAQAIVAVSQGVADDLALTTGLRRDRIQVIHNPVINEDLRLKSQESLDHPWFQAGQPPVLVAVGRLTEQKDYPNLIRAFGMVRAKRPVRLVILGEGEDRRSLEKMIRDLELTDDILLPGFIKNPYPYMVKAAVYILSSKWEGLPTVLIEALYCGVPVVSTDCPSGPKEILKDGLFGRLVPVGNPDILSVAIQDALDCRTPLAPSSSWAPYTAEKVINEYKQALFGSQ